MRPRFNTHYLPILLILVASLLATLLRADDHEALEVQSRYIKWQIDYVINEDYTVETTSQFQRQVLTDTAAQSMKDYTFSYSTSIETAVVLEAYTLKKDGQKIEVPKSNYQVTVNKGSGDGVPVFSDRTRMTIVFPDLEAEDSIVLTLRRTESEPMFPQQFSLQNSFYSQTAYDDVKISVNFPKRMSPHIQIRDMKKKMRTRGERKYIELSYRNPKPFKTTRKDFSIWEWSSMPGFAISTFDDYEQIAQAYGERALPKAVPTARVEALAKEIVGDEKEPRKLAIGLYDWVATNISYAGNCIGVGAVVPHDIDFVLDNRMGDCKDHATLLQALLSSVGVESVQALINSGTSYSLPEVPMVSSVNHVITYLPQFDQYVDSTNASSPFDILSFSIADKPVLLVEGFHGSARTPADDWQRDSQTLEATLNIEADGSSSGSIAVVTTGLPAAEARSLWRRLTPQQERQWMERQFSGQSRKGSATVTRDDPKPLISNFSFSIEFEQPETILSEGAGGMYIASPGFSPLPVYSFAGDLREEDIDYEIACGNGQSSEKLTYNFPDNIRILAIPHDLELEENHVYYKARYTLNGNDVEIERTVRDQTPGNMCAPELMNAQNATYVKISKNLRSQLVYQYID